METQTAAGRATSMSATASATPGQRDVGQLVREHEQAEQHEQADLGDEGHTLVERRELLPVARRCASDGEPDEVDGQESAPTERVCDPERERRRRDRDHRDEGTDRLRDSSEDPGRNRPERDARDEADADLASDEQRPDRRSRATSGARSRRSGRG